MYETMAILKMILPLLYILVVLVSAAQSCTNILVTPGASDDGNPMIAYNADSYDLFGSLYHYPPSDNDDDDPNNKKMRKCYSWDDGTYLGEIPEASKTYNVVGNTNERGLVITETTFGGVYLGNQEGAILDYGSLIWITLQRSETARQAIQTMSHLMDTYGYASSGESFSLADRIHGEVWIMEVISRGSTGAKGAAWVARRVPDGYIAAHSNQARITTFPRNDSDNCLYSHDVVELAKSNGLYNNNDDSSSSNEDDFSFSDIYDKVTFEGARLCDARTWAVFSILSTDANFQQKYESYAKGIDLTNRMPLWIQPNHKLLLKDVIQLLDNHYEHTALASNQDVGAGPFQSPYRSGPLIWHHDGNCFHNERPIAIQKTGFTLVAQIRMHMPTPLSSILWFGVDDSSTAPRYPVYGSSRKVSPAYSGKGPQDGVPSPVLKFDLNKAFWVQNMVANFAYSHQWNSIFPLIHKKKQEILDSFLQGLSQIDSKAIQLFSQNSKDAMIQTVTDYSVMAGDQLHNEWLQYYGELFVRFRDFGDITVKKDNPNCNCEVQLKPYSNRWKNILVRDTGTHYSCHHESQDMKESNNFLRAINQHTSSASLEYVPVETPITYLSKLELKSLK